MPTFDAVSEVDHHELSNAIDQANREIGTRYDFKGSDSKTQDIRSTSVHNWSKINYQIAY